MHAIQVQEHPADSMVGGYRVGKLSRRRILRGTTTSRLTAASDQFADVAIEVPQTVDAWSCNASPAGAGDFRQDKYGCSESRLRPRPPFSSRWKPTSRARGEFHAIDSAQTATRTPVAEDVSAFHSGAGSGYPPARCVVDGGLEN